ncbi:MAG: hypothetical protein P8Z36_12860 [Gemmatimonadota bacterium]|jgi:hypothetical protein
MRRIDMEELAYSLLALAAAGVSPNLFWIAQAGYASLSTLGEHVLVPAVVALIVVLIVALARRRTRLSNRILAGAGAGFIATVGLEVIRFTSFHLGGMPGSMPELLGVLMLNRFMEGPSVLSNVVGWAYHFWNGVSFGIIFAVLFGRKPLAWALVYAELVGLGFLISPAVTAMGIGFMGLDMPAMPITVVVAHTVYGVILGLLCRRWVRDPGWLLVGVA